MSEMSLNAQIMCMKEIREKLGELCQVMGETMDKMQGQIRYLRSEGFSVETEETYQKRYYGPAKEQYLERAKNR